MAWFESLLATLGINRVSLFFGVVGAGLHALRSKGNRFERFLSFMTGCALAAVGPGFIITWFGLQANPSYYGGLGFVCGYFGMAIVDAMTEAVGSLKGMDWKQIFSSWIGRGGGGGAS